jgi:hypothetical protein
MRKTRNTARSQERPGQPKANPSGLPYGCGSIQMRGRTWWMIYRDGEGRVVQENCQTEDQDAARVLVAERALATAQARVAELERIIREGKDSGSGAGTGVAKGRSGSGRVPAGRSKKTRTGGQE